MGPGKRISIIAAKNSCDGSGERKMGLVVRAEHREWEHFGGDMGCHRRFYSMDVTG